MHLRSQNEERTSADAGPVGSAAMFAKRLFAATIVVSGLLAAAAGCKSLTIADACLESTGTCFSCTSDDDCLDGYVCETALEDGSGYCVAVGDIACQCDQYDIDTDFWIAADAPQNCQDQCPDQGYASPDCNDGDRFSFPGADEFCDGLDNDCDGTIDDGVSQASCPLQAGVCTGATTSCVDGAFQDCGAEGFYGTDYEVDELSCDGLDNDCDGLVDDGCCNSDLPLTDSENENCICQVGQVFSCGSDTGACERGVRVCLAPGELSACLTLDPQPAGGNTCATTDDCTGADNFCVTENRSDFEDITDDCEYQADGDDPDCDRRICRTLRSGSSCGDSSDCTVDEQCVAGECRRRTVSALAEEVCNGIDDDCNGRIDDWTDGVCGVCPFNSVRVQATDSVGSTGFVCVDVYEASRPDASASSDGSFDLYSVSRAGVLPWTGVNGFEAAAACRGTAYRDSFSPGRQQQALHPKQLCVTFQWENGCSGTVGSSQETDYPYGDTFEEGTCGDASIGSIRPTGAYAECASAHGNFEIYDMSGNAAEWTRFGLEDPRRIYGGSYADSDPTALLCNDYVEADDVASGLTPTSDFSAFSEIGFRCCAIPAQP